MSKVFIPDGTDLNDTYAKKSSFKPWMTGKDLLETKAEKVPTLVGNWLLQSGLACLAGSSDTGKSALLRQLAISITTGQPQFLAWPINARHNSVVMVSTEDDQQAVSFLISRQAEGTDPNKLQNLHFLFDPEDLLNKVKEHLHEKPADAVIVDCFADAFGGDLKDTQKIRTYLAPWYQLAQEHNCLVLFLHHTGKRTENLEPSKNNLLAGQGFEGKMRLVIELRTDASDPNVRHFCIVKGNYVGREMKHESFVLKFDETNFRFNDTGDRIPFDALVRKPEDNRKAKYEQAKELQAQGFTLEQIAPMIGYTNKGNVSKLLKEFTNVA